MYIKIKKLLENPRYKLVYFILQELLVKRYFFININTLRAKFYHFWDKDKSKREQMQAHHLLDELVNKYLIDYIDWKECCIKDCNNKASHTCNLKIFCKEHFNQEQHVHNLYCIHCSLINDNIITLLCNCALYTFIDVSTIEKIENKENYTVIGICKSCIKS